LEAFVIFILPSFLKRKEEVYQNTVLCVLDLPSSWPIFTLGLNFIFIIIIIIIIIIISGSAAQRGLWPPRTTRYLRQTQRRATALGFLWTSDQLVAESST
jgi:hypothetical protein